LRFEELNKRHEQFFNPVFKEYLESKGMWGMVHRLTRGNVSAIPLLGGVNTRELFQFMWRKHDESSGKVGYYMNTEDTYYDEKLGREVELTEAQKKYRTFYKEQMSKLYADTMGRPVFDMFGKKVTKAKIQSDATKGQNFAATLPDDFMPRIKATLSDLTEKGQVGAAAKEYLINSQLDFLETNF